MPLSADERTLLERNLLQVQARIASACERAGRAPRDVRLVAVTKYVSAEIAAEIASLGQIDLGESRPQQIWEKQPILASDPRLAAQPIRWHMIGPLQRNKIRRTLPLVDLLHSGESLKLLESLDEEAAKAGLTSHVLLEVNLSGDTTKHGFRADELPALLPQLTALTHLRVDGLMTMAALEGTLDDAQRLFAQLRAVRDKLREQSAGALELPELSMGMSDDFERAILEGATLVRVGSALVEGLGA